MSCSCPRVMSPTPGRSTLITSAPNQASSCVHVGPDCTCVKSRILTPSSAFDIFLSLLPWLLRGRELDLTVDLFEAERYTDAFQHHGSIGLESLAPPVAPSSINLYGAAILLYQHIFHDRGQKLVSVALLDPVRA